MTLKQLSDFRRLPKDMFDDTSKKEEMEKYIENIPDKFVKKIFELRFIHNMRWKNIAQKIGGNNTEDSVKKVVYRYLKK